MINGTAKPMAAIMNWALALQVSDLMPPMSVMKVMMVATAATASW